tara:strand:- start:1123 stop:2718 length:1596 start_codon:yes stop_codon:yes gene_type:complete
MLNYEKKRLLKFNNLLMEKFGLVAEQGPKILSLAQIEAIANDPSAGVDMHKRAGEALLMGRRQNLPGYKDKYAEYGKQTDNQWKRGVAIRATDVLTGNSTEGGDRKEFSLFAAAGMEFEQWGYYEGANGMHPQATNEQPEFPKRLNLAIRKKAEENATSTLLTKYGVRPDGSIAMETSRLQGWLPGDKDEKSAGQYANDMAEKRALGRETKTDAGRELFGHDIFGGTAIRKVGEFILGDIHQREEGANPRIDAVFRAYEALPDEEKAKFEKAGMAPNRKAPLGPDLWRADPLENYWQGAYGKAHDQRSATARKQHTSALFNDLVYRYSHVLGSPEKLIDISSQLKFGAGNQMGSLIDQGFSRDEVNYLGYSAEGGSSDRREFNSVEGNIGLYKPDEFLPTDLNDTTITQHANDSGVHGSVAYDEGNIGQALEDHKKLNTKDRVRTMKYAEADKVSQTTMQIMIAARDQKLAEMAGGEKEKDIEDPEKIVIPPSEYPAITPDWKNIQARETVTNEELIRKVVRESLKRSFKK